MLLPSALCLLSCVYVISAPCITYINISIGRKDLPNDLVKKTREFQSVCSGLTYFQVLDLISVELCKMQTNINVQC